MNKITVVYIEAIVMPNNEVLHFGESLGYISDRQAKLLKSRACKLTKGSEPIISLGTEANPA